MAYRHADWQLGWLPALAAELVRLMPDVLVTYTTPGVVYPQPFSTDMNKFSCKI